MLGGCNIATSGQDDQERHIRGDQRGVPWFAQDVRRSTPNSCPFSHRIARRSAQRAVQWSQTIGGTHEHTDNSRDPMHEPDGAYSRFVTPVIGLVWVLVLSYVLLIRSPATRAGC